ncbi:MAG: response regulator transcription factor [Cytophagia bacterium]|nr:response regulator transcription factor [Cytophagia bacterium]
MMTKVLVVENEVLIADDLCDTLRNLDYEVLEPAFDYYAALNVLKTQPVDIVILDIQLGGKKSGLDVAEFIREHLSIPFIYLSSHSDQKTLELAKSTMPYAYLVKPFNSADVLTALEIALNNYSRYNAKKEFDEPSESADLTPMEKVIIRQVAENKTTKEIADTLSISTSTVKNHRHNICVKLQLPQGTHSLLKWAMENKHSLN